MGAMADARVLLFKDVREIWLALQNDALRTAQRHDREHLPHDLVDQNAGSAASRYGHWVRHGTRFGGQDCQQG